MTQQTTILRMGIGLGILMACLFAGAFLVPDIASAQVEATILSGLEGTATATTYDTTLDLPTLIGSLISVLLSMTGMIFLVMTVYAGALYMTAAGDDTKVKKAKSMITTSVIGLIIVIAAYALTNFIITEIYISNLTST